MTVAHIEATESPVEQPILLRHSRDFGPLVTARGRPGSVRVTQIGGSVERATTVIPDVHLRVGGKDTSYARYTCSRGLSATITPTVCSAWTF
jgi:hypothetical protein